MLSGFALKQFACDLTILPAQDRLEPASDILIAEEFRGPLEVWNLFAQNFSSNGNFGWGFRHNAGRILLGGNGCQEEKLTKTEGAAQRARRTAHLLSETDLRLLSGIARTRLLLPVFAPSLCFVCIAAAKPPLYCGMPQNGRWPCSLMRGAVSRVASYPKDCKQIREKSS